MGNSQSQNDKELSKLSQKEKDNNNEELIKQMKLLYKENKIIKQSFQNLEKKQARLENMISILRSNKRKYLTTTGYKAKQRRKSKLIKASYKISKKNKRERLTPKIVNNSINEDSQTSNLKKRHLKKRAFQSYNQLRNRKYLLSDPNRKEYFQRNLKLYKLSVSKFGIKDTSLTSLKENLKIKSNSESTLKSNRFSDDLDRIEQKIQTSNNSYKSKRNRMKIKKQNGELTVFKSEWHFNK